MKFLFVVGVEGSGHFMLRALMQYVVQQPSFTLEGNWRRMMAEYWDAHYRSKNESRLLRPMNRDRVRRKWQTAIRQCRENGISHIMEDMSFPFNQPRNALRRPDILDFVDLIGDQADMRILALYRNPVSATYSGLRRGFTKNVYEQASIVEDNLIYIERHLTIIGRDKFRVLPFDNFLANPSAYIDGLARWIRVDAALLRQGIANLRQPFSREDIPDKIKDKLSDFFSPNKIKLWALLHSDECMIEKNEDRY